MGITPICAHCGRPVIDGAVYGLAGEPYHYACTQPPAFEPRRVISKDPPKSPPWQTGYISPRTT